MALLAALLAAGEWACRDEAEEPAGGGAEWPEGMVEEYMAEGFVPVDWERTELVEFDEAKGRVVMETAEGEAPVFEAGNSLVVDDGTEACIRRVTSVETEGGRVTLETEQGNMEDVFRNVEFELSGELTGRAMSRSADGRPRFHPVSVTVRGADGVTRTWEASRSSEFIAGDSVFERKLDWSGKTLFEAGAVTVGLEDCHLDMSFCPRLYFNFGEREVEDSTGFAKAVVKGWLRDFECSFEGTVDWAVVPSFAYSREFSMEDDRTWEDVLPEMNMRFLVFGVPVWVTVGTDLVAEAGCEASASVELTGGVKGTLAGKLGFGVRNIGKGASLEPISELSGNAAEPVLPVLTAQGSAEASLYVYPQFRVKLYKVLGPTVGFGEGLEAECGWGMRNEVVERHAGLDWLSKLRCSLDYKVLCFEGSIGEEIERTLDSTGLYETPSALEFVPGEEKSVDVGDTVTATFRVNATWFEREAQAVGEGYHVYFEAENVSEPQAVTGEDGMVTVDWWPQSTDEQLVAVVYGKDFEEVARDTADIEVNGKRVSRIVRRNGPGVLNEFTFEYDEEGRLLEITSNNYNVGTVDHTRFSYAKDQVTVEESYVDGETPESYTVTIHLDENGRATESDVSYGESSSYAYDAEGYLSSVREYGYTNRLTVTNGNLERVNWGIGYSTPFSVGTVPNNANIDLFYFICFTEISDWYQAFYLGLAGRRFKNLPTQITNGNSDGDAPRHYSYRVDEENYVTSITESYENQGYDISFDIYYEE